MAEIQKVELKEEDRKLLNSVRLAIENQSKAPVVKPEVTTPEHKHEHFSADLEYMGKKDSCPNCVEGLDKFGKEYMKKQLEERSKLPLICSDCGLGVREDEETCFNCGGKDAEKK